MTAFSFEASRKVVDGKISVGGELIGIARPDPIYVRLDPVGAQEAARRKDVARGAVAAETADPTPIDVKAEMIASARRQPEPPLPASKGTIALAADWAKIGRRIIEPPQQRRDHEREAKQVKVRAALARSTRFGAPRRTVPTSIPNTLTFHLRTQRLIASHQRARRRRA